MTITDPATLAGAGDAPGARAAEHPHVLVLADRCAGCQECVVRCPTAALDLDPSTWTAVADDAACVGCRQCVRTCPFGAIVVEGPALVAPRQPTVGVQPAGLDHDRSETRRGLAGWAEALAEASRCLGCPDPTCVRGCPTHNDIPSFVAAISRGDLDQAHRVLRRTSWLPDICSRVCDQALQCEGACTWSLEGGTPVAIGALERFVADNAPVPPIEATSDDGRGLSVAVVGSGPAGLAAASELASHGASVTLYERDHDCGGLLRWGIPDFTLPDVVARRPGEALAAAGVRIELDHEVTPAGLDRLADEHDAVVVAVGASQPLRAPLPGAELEGVWDATRFLTAAHAAIAVGDPLPGLAAREPREPRKPGSGQPSASGRVTAERPPTVLVLGAGNTAMDVARSARRLGAEAICVDWMDRRFAPVRPDELDEAAAEGVEVRFSTTVVGLEGTDGHVGRALLARTEQKSADRRPRVLGGEPTVQPVDLVVMAMGYRIEPEVARAAGGVPLTKQVAGLPERRWLASGILAEPAPAFARHQPVGRLALGREQARVAAGLPRRERVWFVGDALVGPSTVVEAMAQGQQAARAILHHRPRRSFDPAPGADPERSAGPRAGLGDPGGPLADGSARPRHVLVAFSSRGGTTAALARQVGTILSGRGAEVSVLPVERVGPAQLAWADHLVVATWVEGLVVGRVGPARAARRWMSALPELAGMPVTLLCTYAFSPAGTLGEMSRLVGARGGKVVASAAISRRRRSSERAAELALLSAPALAG